MVGGMHGRGVHGGGHAKQGGMHGQGGMYGWGNALQGTCVKGEHAWGCAWLRACLAGASMVEGMCGQGWPVWLGACVAGEMATAVGVRILLECIFKL